MAKFVLQKNPPTAEVGGGGHAREGRTFREARDAR